MALYRDKWALTRPSHLPRPAARGQALSPSETMRRGREGSEFVRLFYHQPRSEPLVVLVLLDLSGSMTGFERPLLEFLHARLRVDRALSVYGFSTRLTRLTRALKHSNIDRALSETAAATPDRGGGTRIAAALQRLWDRERARAQSALVLISDGLDAGGGTAVFDRWVKRWHGLTHGRFHWWNPLGVAAPETLSAASARTLAAHTLYEAPRNFRELSAAWRRLQESPRYNDRRK